MPKYTDSLFNDYRNLLYPIAFNMLKDAEDAEDLVQETMLKWLSIEHQNIENPKGYLVKTVINKCLNFIRSRKKLESNTELEIPQELIADHLPQLIEKGPVLSLSFMMILEKLNPIERAIFILKEVFAYSHKEMADLLGISEENSRQILARAKKHLKAKKVRFAIDTDHHEELYKRFIAVCEGNGLQELLELLQEDIQVNAQVLDMTIKNRVQAAEYLLYVLGKISHMDLIWWKYMPTLALIQEQQIVGFIHLEGIGKKVSRVYIEMMPQLNRQVLEMPNLIPTI